MKVSKGLVSGKYHIVKYIDNHPFYRCSNTMIYNEHLIINYQNDFLPNLCPECVDFEIRMRLARDLKKLDESVNPA
jgi:hypothetical protein